MALGREKKNDSGSINMLSLEEMTFGYVLVSGAVLTHNSTDHCHALQSTHLNSTQISIFYI